MVNKYAGDVRLNIGRASCRLRYDWTAFGVLKTELGDNYDQALSLAFMQEDLPVIAQALVIGLEHHHPGRFTVEMIVAESPPIIPVITAIRQAINLAQFGSVDPPPENPQPGTGWLKRILTLFSKHRNPPTAPA